MSNYIGEKDYQHGSKEKVGILITNLRTPDAPITSSLKVYLKQFLSHFNKTKPILSKRLIGLKTIKCIMYDLISSIYNLNENASNIRI